MTAFRIAKRLPVSKTPAPAVPSSVIQEMQTKPVRLSFKTDRPFYPYREPEVPMPKSGSQKPGHPFEMRRFLAAADRFVTKPLLAEATRGKIAMTNLAASGRGGPAGALSERRRRFRFRFCRLLILLNGRHKLSSFLQQENWQLKSNLSSLL